MSLIVRATTLLILLHCLSSCSAYSSAGRKSFESKAAQGHVTASNNLELNAQVATTCWDQPAKEPLWNLVDSTTMSVTKINEDEIQVCAIPY